MERLQNLKRIEISPLKPTKKGPQSKIEKQSKKALIFYIIYPLPKFIYLMDLYKMFSFDII